MLFGIVVCNCAANDAVITEYDKAKEKIERMSYVDRTNKIEESKELIKKMKDLTKEDLLLERNSFLNNINPNNFASSNEKLLNLIENIEYEHYILSLENNILLNKINILYLNNKKSDNYIYFKTRYNSFDDILYMLYDISKNKNDMITLKDKFRRMEIRLFNATKKKSYIYLIKDKNSELNKDYVDHYNYLVNILTESIVKNNILSLFYKYYKNVGDLNLEKTIEITNILFNEEL